MLIIPPHRSDQPVDPRKARHDTTVGMLVVAAIMLLIALFIFIVGPRSHSPPPALLGFVVLGLGVIFGAVSFFSWMQEQGDDAGSSDSHKES